MNQCPIFNIVIPFSGELYKTLLNSFWYTSITVATLGLVLFFVKTMSAKIRYWIFSTALILLCSLYISGFFLLKDSIYINSFDAQTSISVDKVLADNINSLPDRYYDTIVTFIDFHISEHENIILTTWFSLILIQLILLLLEFRQIYVLSTRNLSPVSNEIKAILENTKIQLTISKKIAIYESRSVKSPIVVGFSPPIVLIPFGMSVYVKEDLIRAIIAHELAHIKRKDYLFNLLQRLVEIVFFFNPILKWISSRIKFERELCCDAIALTISSKAAYIEALLLCEEYSPNRLSFSFSSGEKNMLLKRVESIMDQKKNRMNSIENKALLTNLLFVVGTSVLLVFSKGLSQKFYSDLFSFYRTTPLTNDLPRVQKDKVLSLLKVNNVMFNPHSFSLKITNYALYLNGIKQSDRLHKKVLYHYVTESHKRLNYTYTIKIID